LTAQAGEDVLAGQRLLKAVVIANMCLYLGDKVILISTSDRSLTSWAGHREYHTVSPLAMCAMPFHQWL
jgi:hypothetical protein